MAIEIGENPDFENIQNKLNQQLKKDLVDRLTEKGNGLSQDQVNIINDHFKHYNTCIKKLYESIKYQQTQTALLESAMALQNEQIAELYRKLDGHKSVLKRILNTRIFGIRLF